MSFWSYFKDLTGCAETVEELPEGATVQVLMERLHARFPKLAPLGRSTLVAVGLDYRPASHALRAEDRVSLFPPVQGG